MSGKTAIGYVCQSFDTVNDQLVHNNCCGSGVTLQHDDTWTIMGWFNTSGLPTSTKHIHIFNRAETSNFGGIILMDRGFWLTVNSTGTLLFHLDDGGAGGTILDIPGAVSVNRWYHFAVANDGSGNLKMLLTEPDGVHSKTTDSFTKTISYTGITFRVGAVNNGGADSAGQTEFSNPRAHDWKFFKYELTDTEIIQYARADGWLSNRQARNTSEIGWSLSFGSQFMLFAFIPFVADHPTNFSFANSDFPFLQLIGYTNNGVVQGFEHNAPFSRQ